MLTKFSSIIKDVCDLNPVQSFDKRIILELRPVELYLFVLFLIKRIYHHLNTTSDPASSLIGIFWRRKIRNDEITNSDHIWHQVYIKEVSLIFKYAYHLDV